MQSTFSITKVTGLPPGTVVISGSHDQPSANGYYEIVTAGSTGQQRPDGRRHLRLVRE